MAAAPPPRASEQPSTPPTPTPTPTHVFVVQKAAASLAGYAEAQTITEIVGVFASLAGAEAAVRACQREFVAEFALGEEEEGAGDPDEFIGLKTEDRGGVCGKGMGKGSDGNGAERGGNGTEGAAGEAGNVPATGVHVGYYWEFDEDLEGHFYSCGIQCFPLIGPGAAKL
jgi:hypothetical protein